MSDPKPPQYADHVKQSWEDIQTSTDSFDQSLLTLSSGALGVSLAFIKDIVPLGQAVHVFVLETSWVAFALCITFTVLSFQVSIAASKKQLEFLGKVYVEGKLDFLNKTTYLWTLLKAFTTGGIVCFLAGLLCTMIFVLENVNGSRSVEQQLQRSDAATVNNVRNFYMSEKPTPGKQNEKVTVPDTLRRGREPVPMQKPATPVNPPAPKKEDK